MLLHLPVPTSVSLASAMFVAFVDIVTKTTIRCNGDMALRMFVYMYALLFLRLHVRKSCVHKNLVLLHCCLLATAAFFFLSVPSPPETLFCAPTHIWGLLPLTPKITMARDHSRQRQVMRIYSSQPRSSRKKTSYRSFFKPKISLQNSKHEL